MNSQTILIQNNIHFLKLLWRCNGLICAQI